MVEKLTLSVYEASEALGISHWTIRKFIREGRLTATRLGRRVMVTPEELRRIVDEGNESGTGGRGATTATAA